MTKQYDVIIIGGGLAGLTAALYLQDHFNILVIDPDTYPRHKMCGEYLSKECIPQLKSLGLNLKELTVVEISQLNYSDASDNAINCPLPLGGIGISRHTLDYYLYQQVIKNKYVLKDKVVAITRSDRFKVDTTKNSFISRHVLLATGKRSNLDIFLKRPFIKERTDWMAVKMHYKCDHDKSVVGLHHFKGGYAGISRVENGIVNLCYLVSTAVFKKYKDIELLQTAELSKNKQLAQFFNTATALWDKPIVISQISFSQKSPVINDMMMIGDSAGLIHPLCGNGMAMAIHSAAIASQNLIDYKAEKSKDYDAMLNHYAREWKKTFSTRLRYGRWIQRFMLQPTVSKIAFKTISIFPAILPYIIKKTHGRPV